MRYQAAGLAVIALMAVTGVAEAQSAEETVAFMVSGVRPGGEEKRVVDADGGVRTVTPLAGEGVWSLEYERSFAGGEAYRLKLKHELRKVDACRYDVKITGDNAAVMMRYDFSRARGMVVLERDARAPEATTPVDYLGAKVERCEPPRKPPCQEVEGNRFGYIPASEAELRDAYAHFQATYCPQSAF
ncbi:hypothetical protein [Afifella pfennigii]|uniref:hypothetical protein n=1 Tax=Afifella pfennigii TaxID=209897 RepID=UPI00047BF547|nr:hypothetical protein [Afifella pfennigii]